MSLAKNDHTLTLPTEVWLQIIAAGPRATLCSLTRVNHALRQMSLPRFLEILDLAPLHRRSGYGFVLQREENKKDRYVEQKALLEWRLHLARTIPDAVRAVSLVPYHGFIEDIYPKLKFLKPTTTHTTLRPLLAFVADRRFFKTPQEHIENLFLSILPSLVHVHELHIRNDIYHLLPTTRIRRCRSIDRAWASWASRLTLLALDVANTWDIDHWFPSLDKHGSTYYTLPLLRTYKLHYCAAEPVSNRGVIQTVFELIRLSPLLEEFEYSLYDASWAWCGPGLMLPQITLHPNLRSFTWSRLLPFRTYVRQQYFIPNAVESCLSQYASQLTRVHLDPAPASSLSYLLQSSTSKLTEIRLNIAFADDPREIFECLSESHVLRILELSGWPLLNGSAGLRKMKVLEELYLAVHYQLFNLQVLKDTAQNTPSLRKLVLRFEGRSLAADPSNWPQGLSELQSTNSSSAVLEIWGVKDFGIYIPGEEIGVLSPLVEAIARLVPSIISFYGTGTMTVPAMMSVDLAWFGKLK